MDIAAIFSDTGLSVCF